MTAKWSLFIPLKQAQPMMYPIIGIKILGNLSGAKLPLVTLLYIDIFIYSNQADFLFFPSTVNAAVLSNKLLSVNFGVAGKLLKMMVSGNSRIAIIQIITLSTTQSISIGVS